MSTRDEILDQIDSLQNLLDDGIMDEEQYQAAKDKLLKKLEEIENEEKQPPKTTSTAASAVRKQVYQDEEDDHYNGGGGDEVDPYDAYDAVDDSAVGATGGGDVIESYLDTHERLLQTMKQTKATESSRWGKSGQVFDETKLAWGSYLDTHEKDQSSRKETKFRSGAAWGKSGEIYDETKLEFGSYLKSEEEKKKQLAEEEARKKMEAIEAIKKKKEGEFLDPRTSKFKLAELQGKFPKGVDPTKKELYLSAEDFKTHFGMTLAEYIKLPPVQKKKLKKNLNLF
ncbi:hypothetical protein C9374_013944 [Naegleria lovaniensis]|uniref:HP domain-containing protein n=1 Tax=Naegleria lovaniensis TaxID=51637 RepID=A0AA88H0P1_NAELO|nr:uncharacterized protein C9374_013944 [Naegleria lovaniensis]KAG2389384.1 hypothetical protein C9374_013944 [Naegleria lovaniensis]